LIGLAKIILTRSGLTVEQPNCFDGRDSLFMKFLSIILFSVCLSFATAAEREPSIIWINELSADKSLPSNTTHQTFYSEAAGEDVGYCLYLPPGYTENTEVRYPVIYNLHGNGGNEFHSFEDVEVLHAGILAGKWPPMIMALPNGGHSTFYKDSHDGKLPIETMFIREFLPHIDRTYRTIAAREGRCIEGFSMGGRGSLRLAMKYPDLFCSLFCQAGNVPRTLANFEAAEKWEDVIQGYLGPDRENYVNNDAFLLLEKNLKKIKGRLRIQMACGTKDGGHLPTVRDFHQHLVEHGVDHTYIELEGLAHRRTEMIKRMEPIWFDYHVESIRLATEAAGK
jgi:endo-1,4-beta-xylanase